jgi:pSer/pThr/pTyr-binding forkhead associated (FHA) protein
VAWTSRVAEYLAELQRLGRERFLASYPHPILVHHETPAAARLEAFAGGDKFRTGVPQGPPVEAVLPGDASDLDAAVHPIRKRKGNPYPDTITVGRAESNDIVVAYDELSKLHAYFTRSTDGALFLADAGSTNGTWVAGVRLAANESQRLAARERIGLGEHAFEVLAPGALADWLASLAVRRG